MLHTAQFRYSGVGRIDITMKSASDRGKVFAPPKELVYAYKYRGLSEDVYTAQYNALLDMRNADEPSQFYDLDTLARLKDISVVLVCYCPAAAFCHRILLVRWMEKHYNTPYHGELPL